MSSWSSRLRLRELRAHYKPYFALGANTMSSWSNRLRLKEPRAQSLLSTLQRKPSTSFLIFFSLNCVSSRRKETTGRY